MLLTSQNGNGDVIHSSVGNGGGISHLFSPDRQSLISGLSSTDHKSQSEIELTKLLIESQEREKSSYEECSRLKARITELEGLLSGTRYHDALKNTNNNNNNTNNIANLSISPQKQPLQEQHQQHVPPQHQVISSPSSIPPLPHPNPTAAELLSMSPERLKIENQENANSNITMTASKENVQKLVAALQAAALSHSQHNTPMRMNHSTSSRLFSPDTKINKLEDEDNEGEDENTHTDRLIFSPPNNPVKQLEHLDTLEPIS